MGVNNTVHANMVEEVITVPPVSTVQAESHFVPNLSTAVGLDFISETTNSGHPVSNVAKPLRRSLINFKEKITAKLSLPTVARVVATAEQNETFSSSNDVIAAGVSLNNGTGARSKTTVISKQPKSTREHLKRRRPAAKSSSDTSDTSSYVSDNEDEHRGTFLSYH